MSCNYNKLKGRIKEFYGTQNCFAKELGIGRVSLSKRLTGKIDFSQSEISRAAQLLKLPSADITEYFFNEKV
ncbi:DUF739 family protein [Robinsoniella peoriensis]